MKRKKKINKKELEKKKQEVIAVMREMDASELPDIIVFNYNGYRVDITEEVYQDLT